MTGDPYREYWRENVRRWAELYEPASPDGHLENLHGGAVLRLFYDRLITPVERRLLHERFRLCVAFIERYVSAGQLVNDVGCGTGTLTTELLARGARVVAIDFVEEALSATRKRVETLRPDDAAKVEYLLMDVRERAVPPAEVGLAIGVAPYVADLDTFFEHVVAECETSYCHFLDAHHWANRLRSVVPMLNVRDLLYTTTGAVEARYRTHGLALVERDRLGTGFLDVVKRSA